MVEAPEKVRAGGDIKLSGEGWKAASRVEIILLDANKREVVGTAVARPDGSFNTSVSVPAGKGKQHLQVVGTSAMGKHAELATAVLIVSSHEVGGSGGPGLAKPVLLTLAGVIPLATWLALEFLSWRGRRSTTP